MADNSKLIGGLIALIGAILFSTKAVLVKLAYQYDIDAVSLLMLRMLFSLPVFLIIGLTSLSRDKNSQVNLKLNLWKVTILGLLGYYLASYLDLSGLKYIDASLERIILFIYPTLVVIFSYLIYKIPIRRIQVVAIVITYIGIIIAFRANLNVSQGSEIVTGALYVLGSSIAYSLYLVGTGDLSVSLGTKVYTSISMSIAALAIIIHNSIVNGFNLFDFVPQVYLYALLISVFATIIPSFLIVEGIRIVGASNSSIIGSVGPISTIILAIIFLGEKISLVQGLGSIIVIVGVILVIVNKEPPAPSKSI